MSEKVTFDKTSDPPTLTLNDISPKWAKRLEQMPVSIFSLKGLQWGLELTAAEACVIGEAYGFSAPYLQTCNVCEIIGSNFQTSFITRSYAKLKKNKDMFVKHWNEKHSYITEKRKKIVKLIVH